MSTTIIHSTHIAESVQSAYGQDTPIFHASCTCGALRDADGYYYTGEDALEAVGKHLDGIPMDRISVQAVDGHSVLVETVPDAEVARHADSTICTRATTTHDCPLSHEYTRPNRAQKNGAAEAETPGAYSPEDRAELTTALETIAASKSPRARELNTREAHLLNARTARRILSTAVLRAQTLIGAREAERNANTCYLAWERDIMTIADLNRRALRK